MKRFFCLLAVLLLLPFSVISEEANPSIIGKWSFYFDIASLPEEFQEVMDNSLLVYDLYLFADGSAFMTNMDISKKTQTPDFSYGALSGVWLGTPESFVVRIGSSGTYDAKIEDGYLLLYMTKALPLAFVKVDTTDKMAELIGY